MSRYWKQHNFMYFHYAKTGGTTFRDALLKALGSSTAVYDNEHATYIQVCQAAGQDFKDTYKVMTTRNPWARFYSHWKHGVRNSEQRGKEPVFKTFQSYMEECAKVEDPKYKNHRFRARTKIHYKRNVMEYCTDKNGNIIIDKFIPIEKLQEGFDEICDMYNVETFDIGKRNASGPQDSYRPHYTDEMRELIAEHCKEEIEFFGYTF